jgi:hypothetical protein
VGASASQLHITIYTCVLYNDAGGGSVITLESPNQLRTLTINSLARIKADDDAVLKTPRTNRSSSNEDARNVVKDGDKDIPSPTARARGLIHGLPPEEDPKRSAPNPTKKRFSLLNATGPGSLGLGDQPAESPRLSMEYNQGSSRNVGLSKKPSFKDSISVMVGIKKEPVALSNDDDDGKRRSILGGQGINLMDRAKGGSSKTLSAQSLTNAIHLYHFTSDDKFVIYWALFIRYLHIISFLIKPYVAVYVIDSHENLKWLPLVLFMEPFFITDVIIFATMFKVYDEEVPLGYLSNLTAGSLQLLY